MLKNFERLLGLCWDANGDGGQQPPTNTPPAQLTPTPPANDDPTRTFKQSELDQLFAERARHASSKAVGDLLKELGIDKADELKGIIQKAREMENAQKTEAQKLADEIANLKKLVETTSAEKDTALAQANERLLKAEVLAEAGKQKFREDALGDVWLVLDKAKVKANGDGTFEGIADAVKEVAKAKPHWLADKPLGAIGTPRPGGKAPSASNPSGEKKPLGIRL